MKVDTWQLSAPVPQREKPAKQAISTPVVSAELSTLRSALNAIPNSDQSALDYDSWRDVVFAIHHATQGSEEGLALAHELSARSAKYDPDFLDNRVWPYIGKRGDGPEITARTIYAKAAANGWQDPTTVDDFTNEVADEPAAVGAGSPAATGGAAKAAKYEFVGAARFSAGQLPTWFIKGVLPRAEIGVIYGESGAGKSFATLDMLGHIVSGLDWRGHKVQPNLSAGYIVAEGTAGFRLRLHAAAKHHENWRLDRLAVMGAAPSFIEREDIIAVGKSMLAWGKMDLLVVDTLARVTAGANENSGEDMGRVLQHCKTLHQVTGAMVLLVHHSGKDAARGARGWSGIKAALDVEIEVTRNGDARCITVTKMKDGQGEGASYGFKLLDVPLGVDEDGEVFGSCVVEHTTNHRVARAGPKGANEALVLRLLGEKAGLAEGDAGLTHVELVSACIDQMPFDPSGGKRDRRRDQVVRAIETLRETGQLVVSGTRIGLPE